MERFRLTVKVGQHRSTVIRNLIDFLGLNDQAKKFGIESFVYIIVWALGKLRIDVTCIFKVFPKLPESRSDEGNFGKNTSEIN